MWFQSWYYDNHQYIKMEIGLWYWLSYDNQGWSGDHDHQDCQMIIKVDCEFMMIIKVGRFDANIRKPGKYKKNNR